MALVYRSEGSGLRLRLFLDSLVFSAHFSYALGLVGWLVGWLF